MVILGVSGPVASILLVSLMWGLWYLTLGSLSRQNLKIELKFCGFGW